MAAGKAGMFQEDGVTTECRQQWLPRSLSMVQQVLQQARGRGRLIVVTAKEQKREQIRARASTVTRRGTSAVWEANRGVEANYTLSNPSSTPSDPFPSKQRRAACVLSTIKRNITDSHICSVRYLAKIRARGTWRALADVAGDSGRDATAVDVTRGVAVRHIPPKTSKEARGDCLVEANAIRAGDEGRDDEQWPLAESANCKVARYPDNAHALQNCPSHDLQTVLPSSSLRQRHPDAWIPFPSPAPRSGLRKPFLPTFPKHPYAPFRALVPRDGYPCASHASNLGEGYAKKDDNRRLLLDMPERLSQTSMVGIRRKVRNVDRIGVTTTTTKVDNLDCSRVQVEECKVVLERRIKIMLSVMVVV
ncbi:hypothetical protein R3P38DRAFT_2775078 [Favolaschia claudopus]|uniref:Uncharacterized protein n=1 Tax=Favolaschia claudopus TaxID=2862362 RepID=A0AAW0BUJ8_9AGAR